jgi:hypothetical protein
MRFIVSDGSNPAFMYEGAGFAVQTYSNAGDDSLWIAEIGSYLGANGNYGESFYTITARGIPAEPTSVQVGDFLGDYQAWAKSTSGIDPAGAISFRVDGAPTDHHIPTAIILSSANSTTNIIPRLYISSNGDIGLGNPVPNHSAPVIGVTIGGADGKGGELYLMGPNNDIRMDIWTNVTDTGFTMDFLGDYVNFNSGDGANGSIYITSNWAPAITVSANLVVAIGGIEDNTTPGMRKTGTTLDIVLGDGSDRTAVWMKSLTLSENITAPANTTGASKIYVESDTLKIKFANGNVKTIVINS